MLVATYNIHRGRPAAGLFHPERIERVIAEIHPDLIALQEAQHYFRRGTGMLDSRRLERELGLRPLHVTNRAGEQGWRSNVLLARREAMILHGPVGLRLGGWEPRGAILVELDLGPGPLRVVATHLSLGARRRELQAAALLEAIGRREPMPTLLLGDLNEWRRGKSALGVLERVFGDPPHPPSFPSFFPRLALDRILADPPALVPRVEVHDTPLARRASDHLPLKAVLAEKSLGE
ncbi:MAG TPA: endonuclease/exonuclease/phosphatase family protein [Roseomonas sp.]|nr:endonuclease/exonuclease/phosphatase family protein [Roseomonas sp.]